MTLTGFLVKTILISLSGVMAPGAVTAAAVAHGARRRWAGTLMAVGHGIVEIPLIFLIMFGLGILFQADGFKIAVCVLGGAFLVWMGLGMVRQVGAANTVSGQAGTTGPLMTGLILSISNPYFLLWWASVGLNLTLEARDLGWMAFLLFALTHWLCDLVWLTILSFGSFHGTSILGPRGQGIVLQICGVALIAFGVHFAYGAAKLLGQT
ncbi:MAG: LysE family transporter [Phycisphaerales bacterium]|nr:MAG: LysE family transporter [Phycisphaerales bacterium]